MAKDYIAKTATFTKNGRYVERGQLVSDEEVDFEEGSEAHLLKAPSGINHAAVVEISAIAPTGPNPKNPQQIAPDVVQTSGGYAQAGAILVGEVTLPEKQRIEVVGIDPKDDTQAKITQALADADAEAASPAARKRASARSEEAAKRDEAATRREEAAAKRSEAGEA